MHQIYKNLLPKNVLQDDAFALLSRKIEEYRKITTQSTELTTNIKKPFQTQAILNQNHLICIHTTLKKSSQHHKQSYFQYLYETYSQNAELLNQFFNNIEQYLSNLISSNISTSYSLSSVLTTFQQHLKNYHSTQLVCTDMVKKYHKMIKSLESLIEIYKESFNQAKLIYNAQQKIKRYRACEQNYKSVREQAVVLEGMGGKLNEKKQEIIRLYSNFELEFEQNENNANIQLYKLLAYFTRGFCDLIKEKMRVINQKQKILQRVKPNDFFYLRIVDVESVTDEYSEEEKKYKTLSQSIKQFDSYRIKDHKVRFSRFIKAFEQALEQQKAYAKIFEGMQSDFFKDLQKSFLGQLKDLISYLEKNKKKFKELFMQQVTKIIKDIIDILKKMNKILETYLNKIWKRLERAHEATAEKQNNIKIMFNEFQNNSQKILAADFIEQKQLSSKYQFLGHLIIGFTDKINKSSQKVQRAYNDTIADFYGGLAEIGSLCGEQDHTVNQQNNTIQQMKKGRLEGLKGCIYDELKKEETSKKIVYCDEKNLEKVNDFMKLKKPAEIQICEKESSPRQNEGLLKSESLEEPIQDESPTKNRKKYREFLSSKITFLDDQQILQIFSCALADKIILQGKLYITSYRLCFSSNFNADNVFFGRTFIQIPKKDIIAVQKRKNGIFFDNSISITTVNGQVFFTSFLKRNNAFQLICKITGKNPETMFYEDSEQDEKQEDSSYISEEVFFEDDLKEEKITSRNEQVQKMLFKHNYKPVTSIELKGQKLNAFKILKYFLIDPVTINRKKYSCFAEYFKKSCCQHKDIEKGEITPSFNENVNANNLKDSCPLFFTQKWSSTFPVMSSGIPFMPKFAKTSETLKIYVISKHKWISEAQVENSGAPYTDTFKLYFRTVCQSNLESICTLSVSFHIEFIKSCMMKSIIESKSFEQSVSQLSQLYGQYKKYIVLMNKQQQQRKAQNQILPNEHLMESSNLQQQLDQNSEQIKQLRDENQSLKQKLESQSKKYRAIIIILVTLYLLRLATYLLGTQL